MIRAVIDTNVWVSAMLTPTGIPAQIVQAGIGKAFTFVFSPALFAELRRVLAYPKLAKLFATRQVALDELEDLLAQISSFSVITQDRLNIAAIAADPSDNLFLACAVEGRADYVVSGDAHLLDLTTFHGVSIVTPQVFWAVLEKRKKRQQRATKTKRSPA